MNSKEDIKTENEVGLEFARRMIRKYGIMII